MCGRFTFDISPEILSEAFRLVKCPELPPHYNIAPTQAVLAVRSSAAGNGLDFLHWGLVPPWAKDCSGAARMINARSETVADKPAYRQALRYRRCLIPASGFYEWRQEGKSSLSNRLPTLPVSPLAFSTYLGLASCDG